MSLASPGAIEWRVTPGLADYQATLAEMEARAAAIRDGIARELVWLVEHPPLVTAGTSARTEELVAPGRFPVHAAGRGGRYTYHGPGQRVGYVLLDLDARGRDIRRFIAGLEGWLIAALGRLGVAAHAAPGRIGIWTHDPAGREVKIGAIGVRVRRWVSFHGFAINVAPDLAHFAAIVPCGISDFPVSSLAALRHPLAFSQLDEQLRETFRGFLQSLDVGTRPLEATRHYG